MAGFGGQGILFTGKVISYAGLIEGKEVSWLPSYGPEMRGGTANCSVCIDDIAIGSPLVLNPEGTILMNVQSYEKFIDKVCPGGVAVIDSSLVDKKTDRTDIEAYYIPATKLAKENNLSGLANIIALGQFAKHYAFADYDSIISALIKCVPPKKEALKELNIKAFEIGYNY